MSSRTLHGIGASVFGVVALAHFSAVVGNAVDVPYWDEWQYFEPNGLARKLDWSWVFHQHVDHRIVPTHLLAWLLYRLDGLDWVTHVAVNFGIFLIIPVLYLWMARLQLGERAWILWPFLWLLLTPHNFETHRWGFQSQWHFSSIFLALGAILLFHPRPSAAKAGLGATSLIGAIGSLSGGVLPAVWIALAHGFYRALLAQKDPAAKPDARRAIAVFGAVAAVAALWAVTFESRPNSPPRVWPTESLFWAYYLNALGLVFGHGRRVIESGAGLLALAGVYSLLWLAPLVWQAARGPLRSNDPTLALRATLVTATLGGFAVLSHGRALYGVSPRYYEMVLPLLPLLTLGWAAVASARWRGPVLLALWMLVASIDVRNWNTTPYEAHRAALLEAEACIRRYYAEGGAARCRTTYPAKDLAPLLDRARQLEVSFSRRTAEPAP